MPAALKHTTASSKTLKQILLSVLLNDYRHYTEISTSFQLEAPKAEEKVALVLSIEN